MNNPKVMPVLDTVMWLGTEYRETGFPPAALENQELITMKPGGLKKIILYSFYRKPMANPLPNLQASAQPEGIKVQTVVNELIRRIKNTSRDLPPIVVEEIIKEYMDELIEGGYSEQWRLEALRSAVGGFERMLEREVKGEGKVNRPGSATALNRRWKKLCSKTTWFQPTGRGKERRSSPLKRKENPSATQREGSAKRMKIEGVLCVPYTYNIGLHRMAFTVAPILSITLILPASLSCLQSLSVS